MSSDSTHARVVRLVGNGKRVLELGCATGYMSRVLNERGCQVVGVELDPAAADQASAHCERVIVGDADLIDLTSELGRDRFDVIVAADFLEHLKDPVGLLRRLRDHLAPGGYVVASLPNVAHGSVRLALLAGSFPYSDIGLLDRTHLRFYTRDSLVQLFEEAGFEIAHLERQMLEISASEVPFPPSVAALGVADLLAQDREARTYQFIVVASPAGSGEPIPLGPRVTQLNPERPTARLEAQWQDSVDDVAVLRRLVADQMQHLDTLRRRIQHLTKRNAEVRARWLDAQSHLNRQESELESLRSRVERLDSELASRTAWAESAVRDVTVRDATIRDLQAQLADQTTWAERSARDVADRDAAIRDLKAQLARSASSPEPTQGVDLPVVEHAPAPLEPMQPSLLWRLRHRLPLVGRRAAE